MKLVSLNVGRPRTVHHQGRAVRTGIFKDPVSGPVWLRRLNLDGDGQADLRVHGGADKAAYAYPFEHYPFWARELGRDDLAPGNFGENFTVEGLLEDSVHIGDVFRIGEALVQVTQPRTPCFKLGVRFGDDGFPARFHENLRTGFYLRVLAEGRVAAGDVFERTTLGDGALSVQQAYRLRHFPDPDPEWLARGARIEALAPSWRAAFARRLQDRA